MNVLEVMLHQLKRNMKDKGITGKEIAREVGLSVTTVSFILNGISGTYDTLKKIIDYIDSKEV